MITVTMTGSAAAGIETAGALPRLMDGAIVIGLNRGLLHAAAVAQREYLSGPRPSRLGQVTTRLAKSIVTDVNQASGNMDNGVITGVMGSAMRYAAYHEFGFHGTVSVRAFTRVSHAFSAKTGEKLELRRTIRDHKGNIVGFKENNVRALARRKNLSNVGFSSVTVRSHSRRIDYKGRPFIRPAMEASLPVIEREINREISTLGSQPPA